MVNTRDEIFVLSQGQVQVLPLRAMREGLFGEKLEAAFQKLVETHPDVIPGAQVRPGASEPPRFLLVRPEAPISGWWLDLLMVDQSGIPTLIECKLLENPESRREVVGQTIEYAANAADAWGAGKVRQFAQEYWSDRGQSVEDLLQTHLGIEDADAFWAQVDENLREGKIRLIIAGDQIRPEVRRMIEFLNGEMRTVEILGLELKCYGSDEGHLVLVPAIVGQTQASSDRRKPDQSRPWTAKMLHEAYESMPDRACGQRLAECLEWAVNTGGFIKSVTLTPSFGIGGETRILSAGEDGSFHLYFEATKYPAGTAGRDTFVDQLKTLQLLDPDVDPTKWSSKNLRVKIQEMDTETFSSLLNLVEDQLQPAAEPTDEPENLG